LFELQPISLGLRLISLYLQAHKGFTRLLTRQREAFDIERGEF
jgi:hypothetical protein